MFARVRSPLGAGHLVLPLVCGFVLGSLATFLLFAHPGLDFTAAPAFTTQKSGSPFSNGRQEGGGSVIPPIIHFVQLKEDRGSLPHFSFEAFLALFAAYHHVDPTAIYIHHDFSDEELANATQHGSSWTRRVLTAFGPLLQLNRVTAPTEANGHVIERVEHRSDFVRLTELQRHGGIYLDWDVLTLAPLAPLRHAGYRTVVGRQFDGFINNGILLAVPGPAAATIRILDREARRVFDGGWITHSVELLTRVADRLAAVPGEVLIMDFRAFAPFSWEQASVDRLLRRHAGEAVPAPAPAAAAGRRRADYHPAPDPAESVWATREMATAGREEWAYDFSDALFLHKIFNSVDAPPGYSGVNVPYVLARDSNYALATWPLVMEGIRQGFIDAHDETF